MGFHRLRSIRLRLVLAFLVTVLLPLMGTGLYGNWTTSRTLERQALDSARADLRLRARQIETYLAGVRENLLFLSRLDSLAALLVGQPTPAVVARLQADFAGFAATHPDAFQTRYLDATGLEVVRVDSTSSGPLVVPTHRLQNKADRFYFSATMRLRTGQVYISPVDLNREFGAIQVPHVPTLRYATPVFHPDGTPAGIVILNLYAEPWLRFAWSETDAGAVLAMVDESGYYLAHPDSAREWGGPDDLGTGLGAAADYPDGWPEISQAASGVYAPPAENWLIALSDEVLPVGLFAGERLQTRRVLVYETVQPGGAGAPRWLLLHDEPRVNLLASVWDFRLTAIAILSAAGLAALVMAVGLARSLSAPILALTREVREFGQRTLARRFPPAHPEAGDEIGELTAAFAEMSAAIDRHLEQLSMLNRAGHHIASRVERRAVLEASARAATTLLPAAYCVIHFDSESGGRITHAAGEARWAAHRSDPALSAMLGSAIAEGEWRTAALAEGEQLPAGYLCSAPLCVSGRPGLIELYGEDPSLGDAASGNLLATIAAQVSIALENAQLYERLAERGAELQSLVEQLITAQEEERRVVAYDIHDGLIQMLVGARLLLGNALADAGHDPEPAAASLKKGLAELAAAMAEARRVIEGLRPAALDDLGLVAALREFASESLADCDCRLDFTASPPDLRLPPAVEITAFRIAQEAITNARRYSGSAHLRVALVRNGEALTVEVQDWGSGFDPSHVGEGRGLGLTGMRERARLLGGECRLDSAPGAGTTVGATLPLTTAER